MDIAKITVLVVLVIGYLASLYPLIAFPVMRYDRVPVAVVLTLFYGTLAILVAMK